MQVLEGPFQASLLSEVAPEESGRSRGKATTSGAQHWPKSPPLCRSSAPPPPAPQGPARAAKPERTPGPPQARRLRPRGGKDTRCLRLTSTLNRRQVRGARDAGERDPQTQTLLLSGRRSRHFLAGRAARTGCDPAANAAARRALQPPAPPAPRFQPDPPSPALQPLGEPRSSRPLCSVEVRSEAPCLGLEGGVGVQELNSRDPREKKVPHRLPRHTHTQSGGKEGERRR